MSSVSEDRAKERNLTRIATRGVTQLFNAVAERQKLVDKKLEELQKTKQRSKRQKVVDDLKSNDFFANLHTRKQKIKVKPEEEIKQETDLDGEDMELDEF